MAATDVKNDASLGASLTSAFCISATVTEDSQGSNTLTDNNTVTSVTGLQDEAVDFESTNSEYLSITNAAQSGLTFSSGSFAIAMMVKPETLSLGYSAEIAGKAGSASAGWYIQQLTSGVIRFIIDGATAVTSGTTAVTAGVWNQIVITYDGTNIRLYINGILRGGPTAKSNPTSDTADFRISSTVTNGTRYFDGVVGQCLIYSKNLTATNVTDLWASGSGIPFDLGGAVSFIPKIVMS